MNPNLKLTDMALPVTALAPTTPSSSVPDYVCLKNFNRLTVVITVDNAATVTGSAITLKQAQAVANTGEKALAFSTMLANTDTGAADTLTATAVTSNTFTTNNTDNKNLLYVLDVRPEDLDLANSYDCVRLGTGNATNTVLSAMYFLHHKFPGGGLDAITD